ncbi:hypothetical protein IWX90DRAFT_411238 [Phyllosticta citrichinensis]|uniref:Secreted protein n=1 Tax=Phyllosticta citrichinensis TaxID=1130410 RepID=A0ABR1Y8B7_9PEZI
MLLCVAFAFGASDGAPPSLLGSAAGTHLRASHLIAAGAGGATRHRHKRQTIGKLAIFVLQAAHDPSRPAEPQLSSTIVVNRQSALCSSSLTTKDPTACAPPSMTLPDYSGRARGGLTSEIAPFNTSGLCAEL